MIIEHSMGGRTVGDSGGRIQWSFFDDDDADVYVNLVNDIEIEGPPPPPSVARLSLQTDGLNFVAQTI